MELGYLQAVGIPSEDASIALQLPEDVLGRLLPPSKPVAAKTGAPAAKKKVENAANKDKTTSAGAPKEPKTSKPFGFLQEIIEADLAPGGRCVERSQKTGDVIRTRFPPEPNGYLHIGHAKSITINFSLAQMYGGRCHLRFDDTNPAAEETEFVESIQEDVKWLGFDWGEHCYFASSYFDQLYEWAEHLIKVGKAYVDSENREEMAAHRGSVTTPGTESKFRNRSVKENLDLFREMKAGKYQEGEHVLRMKGDMKSSNMNMRDMPIYRILHKEHHRTGNKWKVYPLYDFAHGQEDAIEGITHSICTLEFELHRELYNWFTANLPIETVPVQHEFARLNVTNFVTSKRKLKKLVDSKVVDGWDDPRMSTISGLRRRGVTPEALKTFILKCGVTKGISVTDVALLEDCIIKDLDAKVERRMVVLDPLKVVIENYPEGQEEAFEAMNHPSNPSMGTRKIMFAREVWIERSDFREEAPDSYFRLKPGGEVKLRYGFVLKFENMIKDATGKVVEVRCSYVPGSREAKCKGVIHWVSSKHGSNHKVRLYDYLLKTDESAPPEEAEDEGEEVDSKADDFLKLVNPDSLTELTDAKLEALLSAAKPFDRFQFERNGYFVVDKYSAAGGPLVFNRIIGLKESGFAKEETVAGSATAQARSRKDEQAKQAADKEARKKIDPREMFRVQTTDDGKPLYAQFDDDGVPTHDQNGEALNKTRCKKLKQEWEKQKKTFELK